MCACIIDRNVPDVGSIKPSFSLYKTHSVCIQTNRFGNFEGLDVVIKFNIDNAKNQQKDTSVTRPLGTKMAMSRFDSEGEISLCIQINKQCQLGKFEKHLALRPTRTMEYWWDHAYYDILDIKKVGFRQTNHPMHSPPPQGKRALIAAIVHVIRWLVRYNILSHPVLSSLIVYKKNPLMCIRLSAH